MTTTVSGSQITFNDNTTQNTSAYGGGFAFRNRIINGDMRIDQRNAGASVTLNAGAQTFMVDRWSGYEDSDGDMTAQQDSSAPNGFVNSIKFTTTTADATLGATQRVNFRQRIEGLNIADLAWGTANAQTVTLSFWTRSSLTGTFGGSIINNALDRSYPFTYTISVANTWEYKTITIPGDTSGTWLTTNGIGMQLIFGLGVGSTYSGTAGSWAATRYESATGATSVIGTLNATFYITGVQLEKGSTATSFDYRPYGQELALCQRYYYKVIGEQAVYWEGYSGNLTYITWNGSHPVEMRASPTCALIGTYATSNCTSVSINTVSTLTINIQANGNGSAGARTYFHSPTSGGYSASIEL